MASKTDSLSFWDHLDVLRVAIVKVAAVAVAFGIAAFFFKEPLFAVVLAPKDDGFVTYRLLGHIAARAGGNLEPFAVELVNTGLARQFAIHMKAALGAGMLCASPYILYQLFRFVAPALYEGERKYAVRLAGAGYAMFGLGMLVGYFLVFPLAFRFLGTYQVSSEVGNLITLDSYVSTLLTTCLSMGIVFEIPVLSWLLARMGLLSAAFMRRYRKHAIVAILALAAIVTPTSDVFTLSLVAMPMWALYEASIRIVERAALPRRTR